MHNCHIYANCANTIGSFTCSCKPGFSGNGTFCQGNIWRDVICKVLKFICSAIWLVKIGSREIRENWLSPTQIRRHLFKNKNRFCQLCCFFIPLWYFTWQKCTSLPGPQESRMFCDPLSDDKNHRSLLYQCPVFAVSSCTVYLVAVLVVEVSSVVLRVLLSTFFSLRTFYDFYLFNFVINDIVFVVVIGDFLHNLLFFLQNCIWNSGGFFLNLQILMSVRKTLITVILRLLVQIQLVHSPVNVTSDTRGMVPTALVS